MRLTLALALLLFTVAPPVSALVIDDFESGLPSGSDGDGAPLGFNAYNDGGSSISIGTTTSAPMAVPGSVPGNSVLAYTADTAAFTGFNHAFTNPAVDTWISQDWSSYESISLWLYGNDTGTALFFDLLDNRNTGSTTDDAERWTVGFQDDFTGWQLLDFEFSSFTRKEIGNGAPNDGLGLTEVHGYGFGNLNTSGEVTFYLDDVSLAVPEPGSAALLIGGLAALGFASRQRRRLSS